jgi:hypothetical protein
VAAIGPGGRLTIESQMQTINDDISAINKCKSSLDAIAKHLQLITIKKGQADINKKKTRVQKRNAPSPRLVSFI